MLTDAEQHEVDRVDALAVQLQNHLGHSAVDINAVHIHGAKSADVQRIVARLRREVLGFAEETPFADEIGLTRLKKTDDSVLDAVHRTGPPDLSCG